MKKRLFIFGVCLCVAGRLIAQDVHFMMQHEKTAMKSSVHGSKGIPLKLKTNCSMMLCMSLTYQQSWG